MTYGFTKNLGNYRSERLDPTSEISKKISDYYDRWTNQFKENPDLWKQELKQRASNSALEAIEKTLKKNLMPVLEKEDKSAISARIAAIQAMFLSEFDKIKLAESSSNRGKSSAKKFGKLVIGKTTGYAARWLYRRLKANLEC
jgi:hypothetical protein